MLLYLFCFISFYFLFFCVCVCPAGKLHRELDGGKRRAESVVGGGQEGAAEGDGHTDRAREQGADDAGPTGTAQYVRTPRIVARRSKLVRRLCRCCCVLELLVLEGVGVAFVKSFVWRVVRLRCVLLDLCVLLVFYTRVPVLCPGGRMNDGWFQLEVVSISKGPLSGPRTIYS